MDDNGENVPMAGKAMSALVHRAQALEDAIMEHEQAKRSDLSSDQIDPSDERLWSVLKPIR